MANFNTRVWDNERIFMVDFGRAKKGAANSLRPDVDDVGYHDDAHNGEHGPIVSTMVGTRDVRVRFYRTEISTSAPLYVTSSNRNVMRITYPANGKLRAAQKQLIRFHGRRVGRAIIEVRYRWPDGPVIGRLYVQVYSRILVRIRAHLVTVNGLGHANNFMGGFHSGIVAKRRAIKRLIAQANHTWLPHGIQLQLGDPVIHNTVWGAAQMGVATNNPSFRQFTRAGALSPNRSPAFVNLFFLPQWAPPQLAFGANLRWVTGLAGRVPVPPVPGVPPMAPRNRSGVYVRTNVAIGAQLIAHEFGHYMGLCHMNPPAGVAAANAVGHSAFDLFGTPPTRDDLVTRRRLMYPLIGLNPSRHAWRRKTGYGTGKAGSFVTYRRLTQDVSMEESQRARTTTQAGANFNAL